jgi:hypothetical protein
LTTAHGRQRLRDLSCFGHGDWGEGCEWRCGDMPFARSQCLPLYRLRSRLVRSSPSLVSIGGLRHSNPYIDYISMESTCSYVNNQQLFVTASIEGSSVSSSRFQSENNTGNLKHSVDHTNRTSIELTPSRHYIKPTTHHGINPLPLQIAPSPPLHSSQRLPILLLNLPSPPNRPPSQSNSPTRHATNQRNKR